MIREQGQWVVGDVRSIKELVEYRDETFVALGSLS